MIVISTDYRDLRKAAYQQYAVALDYNVARIPPQISVEDGSAIGVAFITASLALGVCMGVDFSQIQDGPNLLKLVRNSDAGELPDDVRDECINGINEHERANSGDWLAIWGGKAGAQQLVNSLTNHFQVLRHQLI